MSEDIYPTSSTQVHWRVSGRPHAWQPPTDLFETDEALVLRSEIAGMNEGDFSIQLEGRSLSIRGVRPDPPERRAYHQMEIRFGEFFVEVELPAPILADKIEATYQGGFLRIVLPKAAPRRIQVEAQSG